MDRTDLDNLSGAYEFMDVISAANTRELDDWAVLATIVGPGRRLSDAEAAQLRAALSRARSTSNLMAFWAVRMRQVADSFALPYDRATFAEYGEAPLVVSSICRSLRTDVPPTYGLGTHEGSSDVGRAAPITLDDPGKLATPRPTR